MYLAGWKRAQADYQNREKEIAKEKSALRELVEENLVSDFLPILDNLEKVVGGIEEKNSWVEGLGYVIIQFKKVLSDIGIEEIILEGKEFDPNLAEAAERKGDDNIIIEVLLKGYKKGDRVIRPARVIVGTVAEKM